MLKREFKKLTVLSLIFFFAIGVWCAMLTAPGLSAAWGPSDCSSDSSSLEQARCDYTAFNCASDSLLSPGSNSALASIQTDGSFSDARFTTISALDTRFLNEVSLSGALLRSATVFNPARKVSVHLFNSILTR